MWPRRLVVVAGLLVAPAAIAAPRVAFVNTAGADAPASHALDAARQRLAAHGFTAVGPGAIRDALEGPLARSDDGLPLAQVDTALAAARERYADFEYDVALSRLAVADRVLTAQVPSRSVLERWVERQVLAGLIYAGQEHEVQARAAFALARQLDPTLALDPAKYQPAVLELFDDAGHAARATRLAVDTEPTGAALWIDGRAVGAAPLTTTVSEGSHWIVATATGRSPAGALVRVSSGTDNLSLLELDALPAAARITELRAPLVAGRVSDDDQRTAAHELCALAGADVLLIVSQVRGELVARAFDSRSSALGEPAPLGSADLLAALGDPDDHPIELTGHAAHGDQPWYQSTWGKGILLGAGAMVAGTLLYVAFKPDDHTDGVTIGGWCFSGACP